MLRGVKKASSSSRRRRGLGWKAVSENMKRREWKNEEDSEGEEEEEEGECFSVDSLENGRIGGTKFNTNKIKIATVLEGQ